MVDIKKLIDPEIRKIKSKHGDITEFIDGITCNDDTYYFLNVFKNKRDLSYVRGSIFKAMSIASRYPVILKRTFDGLLDQALNDYFSVFSNSDSDLVAISKAEAIMSQLYTRINNDYDVNELYKYNIFERCFYADNDETKVSMDTDENYTPSLSPDTASSLSGASSLREFIIKFGEKVMLIFNYILLEKRVLFIGNKQSANVMAEYVYT